MKRFWIFVFIISFGFVQSSFAETAVSNTSPTYTTSGTGTNKTAKESGGQANIAMIASGAAAAGFFAAAAAAPPPKKPLLYALAAANVAAAMMMSGGSSNAADVEQATLGASPTGALQGYTATNTKSDTFESSNPGLDAELATLDQQIRDAGYIMSPDGSSLTLPDGSTVSTAALAAGNVPGMEMTDDLKAQAAAIEAEAMKKASGAKVVAIGLQDGGGGGGMGMGGGEGASSKFDMAKYLKSLKNRDPSSVSGLSKKLGEDNIGIKSDNIFDMISRQYKRKQSQSAFIK